MDALSEQNAWNELPTRPRPELYQFRGDYVNNERNRRNRARTLAAGRDGRLQQKRPHTVKSNRGPSPTTAKTGADDDNDENRAPNPKKWDSYCAHISCHALAQEQQTDKAKNRKKFLAFLRSASSKRQVASSSRGQEKESGQGEAERSQKSKKPPVPR